MPPKITKPKHKPRSKPSKTKSSMGPSGSSTTINNSESALFFYGYTSGPYDFLSQHYLCSFTAPTTTPSDSVQSETLTFLSTEQYMMYHKALLFSDTNIAAQIMATHKPAAQKALGRKVSGFDDEIWKANRERIVEEGNWWKFVNGKGSGDAEGNMKEELATKESLKERLLETGRRELVEASPRDRIWGIGFGSNNAEANRARWGLNLLGKALMRVRERLREEEVNGVSSKMQNG